MEEIVYLSIRLGCTAYLLYKVWEQKKRIGKICDLLYTPRKKTETEKDHRRNPESAADVMGATRFVYLDENAGKTVAPYMSQQLEMGSDLIGKDEDIPEDEVECKLPLEEMRMLKDEQEELDSRSPEAEAIVPAVSSPPIASLYLSVNTWINSSIPSPAAFCKTASDNFIITLFAIYINVAKLRTLLKKPLFDNYYFQVYINVWFENIYIMFVCVCNR